MARSKDFVMVVTLSSWDDETTSSMEVQPGLISMKEITTRRERSRRCYT